MRRFSVAMACVLVCMGLCGLIGCILLPGSYQRDDGKPRPETLIGTAKENRPLRLLEATRADVERVLGKADRASADGRTMRYDYSVTTMYLVTLCFGAGPADTETRQLILHFTEDGRLRDFRVTKDAREADRALGL